MGWFDQIFGFYDSLILRFPDKLQVLISLVIIVLIVICILGLLKHGHWIFVLLFVILFPGAWPALRTIFLSIWLIIKFLLVRIDINI